MKPQTLSAPERKQMDAALAAIEDASGELEAAQQRWARLVRKVGIAATARHMGLTAQAVSARLRVIEGRKGRGA